MTTQAENLSTVERIKYPTEEQISNACNDALRLYNIAGGNFGLWSTTKDKEVAHFTKSHKHSRLIAAEVHISLPADGSYGVDISRTGRTFTESGHDSYTQFTALRPHLDPEDQPEVITETGKHVKDISGENASGIIEESSGPLSVELLSSVDYDLQAVLLSEGSETVAQARPGRLARLVGRLASTG